MESESSLDCWGRASRVNYKEGHLVSVLIVILFVTIALVTIYFFDLVVGLQWVFMGVDVLSLLCWVEVPLFFLIIMMYGKKLSKQPPDRIMVDCISQYYTVSQDTEYFEDFKWMIDVKGAVVIDYNWDQWLVIPSDEHIYILSPYHGNCTDLYIGRKMVSRHTQISRTVGNMPVNYKGSSVSFQRITCDLDGPYYQQYYDALKSYEHGCYICSSKDTCDIAKTIIDAINRKRMVCGVSLGGLYTHRYFGLCAKTPKSREEFDMLLSFAAELKEMLKCEENS